MKKSRFSIAVCSVLTAGCQQQGRMSDSQRSPAHLEQKPASIKAVQMPGDKQNDKDAVPLALQQLRPRAQLTVTSPAFDPNAAIPETYSDLGERISPPLQWSNVPAGTQSLVLIMEDPDATEPKPFIHWVLYDVPSTETGLRLALPPSPQLPALAKARQGINSRGTIGYFGPHPPPTDGPHHYHFQVFALDKKLGLLPGKSKDEVMAAMRDHVLAGGELIGLYGQTKEGRP